MPNDRVFDSKPQAAANQAANTFRAPGAAVPAGSAAAQAGVQFAYAYTNTVALGVLGGSVYGSLQIANPGGSGKSVYLVNVFGGVNAGLTLLSSFTGLATLTRGGTLGSPTTVAPLNTRLGNATASVATVRTSAAAVAGGTTAYQAPMLQSSSFFAVWESALIVPPGQTVELAIQGTVSLLAVTMSVTVSWMWWEA